MHISGRKLLFVEDDSENAARLGEYFSKNNATVFVDTIEEALRYLRFIFFDAVVLDLCLPDGSGFSILKHEHNLPPTVIYSDLSGDEDIIEALYLGAADYVVKPCSMRLLEARLRARLLPSKTSTMHCEGLTVNPINKTAKYYEETVSLTKSEFNILSFLMNNSGTYYGSDELYEKIWHERAMNTQTIRKHISSMRQKLHDACDNHEFINTEFGSGYAFIGKVTYE